MTNKGTFLVRIKRKKRKKIHQEVQVAENVIIKIDLTILS